MQSKRVVEGIETLAHDKTDTPADTRDVDRADLLRLRLRVRLEATVLRRQQHLRYPTVKRAPLDRCIGSDFVSSTLIQSTR